MKKKNYLKILNDVYSYQFKDIVKKLPLGQVNYHKKNFSKYFNLDIKNFNNVKILDTGAGSGVHSSILSLMGAHVLATDVLQSNIKKIKRFIKIYRFKNLKIFQHDFTKKLKSKKKFELISCHNWVQHTPKPHQTIHNIIQNLQLGGKIYISCYHANTFRFYIAQIAREILNPSHFELLKRRMKYKFKDGFEKYNNQDDIGHSNLTDDFFSPYVVTTTYPEILKLSKNFKLKIYTKIPKIKKIETLDNIPLRVGLKKIGNIKKPCKKYFHYPVNEFKNPKNKILKRVSKKSKKIIKLIKKENSNIKIDFCLGLYKIRANTSLIKSYNKYILLEKYIEKYIEKYFSHLKVSKKN